jgi:hypothetical protein
LGIVNWNKKTQDYLQNWGPWTNAKHWQNFRFVKIDHGWSFADIKGTMDRNSTPWCLFNQLGKPTNHFNDYNYSDFYTNPTGSFRQTLRQLSELKKKSIFEVLETAFQEINRFYGDDNGNYSLKYALQSTAKWIGCPSSFGQKEIIGYLTEKLYSRAQGSMK